MEIGSKEDSLLMKWVFEHKYIPEGDISKAVHERLCAIGRKMYEKHIRAPLTNYPDHSASPEALGYALLHGIISADEALMIHFDHNETVDMYRKKAEKLHESVMQQLATGETYLLFPEYDDKCCSGCCYL